MREPADLFDAFYTAIHGHPPYAWQRRLFSHVVEHGTWPEVIDAPTGSGKSSVVDVHVAANAWAGSTGEPAGLPRRLVMVVPRRALVDDQLAVSELIAESVRAATDGILAEVRQGLWQRAGRPASGSSLTLPDVDPLLVASARGGMTRRRSAGSDPAENWPMGPERTAVLHFTPDMLGSALLFRSYSGSVGQRPIHAGLLALDTVAVVDEAHLAQQLTMTARRVSELQGRAERSGAAPALQVVSTSATAGDLRRISGGPVRIGVDVGDLDQDEGLRRRLQARKSVTVADIPHALTDSTVVDAVVARLTELHDTYGGPVGCVVNTVKAATRIGDALRKHEASPHGQGRGVVTIVGRMRAHDRERLTQDRFPGVLTPAGHPDVSFVVATQTVEVGVDLDLSALVTELASANALAQRAGRVNRQGLRADAPVHVLVPSKASGVYTPGELSAGREWVEGFTSLSPWEASQHPPALPDNRRVLWQRLEAWDGEYLAATRERLASESGVSPAGIEHWLRESFDESADVAVVVRDLPQDDVLAEQLLTLTKPLVEEQFPCSITEARDALANHLRSQGSGAAPFRRFFTVDPQTERFVSQRPPADDDGSWRPGLRPGEVVVVDATAAVFTEGVLSAEGRDRADDVLTAASAARGVPVVVLQVTEGRSDDPVAPGIVPVAVDVARSLSQAMTAAEESPDESAADSSPEPVTELLRDALGDRFDAWGLDGRRVGSDLTVEILPAGTDEAPQLVVVRAPRPVTDGDLLEVRAGRGRPVRLDDHQRDVADRVAELASIVGLPDEYVLALRTAALLHDEGKRDSRFQTLLRRGRPWDRERPALAKSRTPTWVGERRFRARAGLNGWRHEQLSAAVADARDDADDLVTRLVGTSHGYGRSVFDHDTGFLIPPTESVDDRVRQSAQDLFDRGRWSSILDDTARRHGWWGVAYLEALLRAADTTISAEGR